MNSTIKRIISFSKVASLTTILLSTLASSETFDWKNVKIGGGGGFVPNIIYNPTKPGLVYARTDMGGIYRRDSVSGTWIPLTDWIAPEKWNMLGGESFATDPVDPKICYFAAGTYTNDWTDMNGQILRSKDCGKTWEDFEMPFKFGGNMPGRGMGERLAIDPNSNNVLYFGARSGKGLWKSTDFGETWKQVTSFPVVGDYVQDPQYAYTSDKIGVVWIAFDKSSSASEKPTMRLFAGVAQKSGPTVYESNDAGETWAAIPDQPTGPSDSLHLMPHHGVVRDSFLFIPYNNKCGPYDGSYGEIWKYNLHSNTWIDISPHNHEKDESWGSTTLQTEKPFFGYGGFDVDPQNSNVIITATLNSYWPDAKLFKSVDGGASWTCSYYWTSYPSAKFKYTLEPVYPWLNWGVTTQSWPDVVNPKLGWMISGIAINPFNSKEFMYGTGATIYGTENFNDWGDSTKKVIVKSVADGIEECAVLSLAVPPITSGDGSNVKLVTGVGDIGGFTHTDLQTPTQMFLTPRFGNTSSIDYAELDPKIVVRVGTASPELYEAPNNIASSSDGGLSWTKVYALDSAYKVGCVSVSAKGSSVLWAADGKVPYCGSLYGLKETNLPANVWTASDRVNDTVFYAFKDSLFYSGSATSFTASSMKLPFSISKIKAVPGNEGHVWLPGGTKGLWCTTDGGKTFNQIDTTVVKSADIIGYGKAAPGATYPAIYITGKVSGKSGVFLSKDKGATWIRINDDAHQYGSINYAITGDMRQYGIVFVGTNGRGVVYGQISGTSNVTLNHQVIKTENKLIRTAHFLTISGKENLKIFDLRGKLLRTGYFNGKFTLIEVSGLAKGLYFAHWGKNIEPIMIRQ